MYVWVFYAVNWPSRNNDRIIIITQCRYHSSGQPAPSSFPSPSDILSLSARQTCTHGVYDVSQQRSNGNGNI